MKLVLPFLITLSKLLNQVYGGEGGFTYFETGGVGPSNWATLKIEENQCGGTMGKSTYGQSPVTIDGPTADNCDTGMSQFSFTGGDCQWSDLKFEVTSGSELQPTITRHCDGQKISPNSADTHSDLRVIQV